MVEAILISKPKIDFENLFRISAQALGRHIGRESDPKELSEVAKFLACVESFSETARSELFLHYVFICYADAPTAFAVREQTKLDITSTVAIDGNIIFLAAGTLSEWEKAIEICCSEKSNFNTRLLFDKLLLLLEKEGLRKIWFDYRKKMIKDNTFLIEKI